MAVALLVLGLGEAIMVFLLADDLSGRSRIPPLVCALIVAVAVAILLAARRRAPDDPGTGRALVVLGCGVAFAALASTALLLAIYSIS